MIKNFIWYEKTGAPDTYGEFIDFLEYSGTESVGLKISVDSDYSLFINGKFVASNQFGDFDWYKVYDDIDVTDYLVEGKNVIALLVWYFGEGSQRYYLKSPGTWFEFYSGNAVLLESSEKTLCRKSRAYESGRRKKVTIQLGFGFAYDSTREDGWILGSGEGFGASVLIPRECELYPRIGKKLYFAPRKTAKSIRRLDNGRLHRIDLGCEVTGCPVINIVSEVDQRLLFAYGEHLEDGAVRRLVGGRDFSYEYVASRGENEYTNYMFRVAGRYIEVYSEQPITVSYVGILPQLYPTKRAAAPHLSEEDMRIYELCAKTLELCMMEHYVDCPWREQCLYAFDSRNQMLCGYYAFEGGNTEYAKANLMLISMDRRADDLLSVCSPCGVDLTIPSFSCYYFLSVKEYLERTGDAEFAKNVYPKLLRLARVFKSKINNGMVYRFSGENHWNFYDWSKYLQGTLRKAQDSAPDLTITVLYLMALRCLEEISKLADERFGYSKLISELENGLEAFYDREYGLYSTEIGAKQFNELPNALMILYGGITSEREREIAKKIADRKICECSLSMKVFVYDALLKADAPAYRDLLLSMIRDYYGKMLSAGATAAWETINGASDFHNAGSLCHGWSSVPIYVYHRLFG